jgi:hypothetical protein
MAPSTAVSSESTSAPKVIQAVRVAAGCACCAFCWIAPLSRAYE